MKPASVWLREYGATHQNRLNKQIHFICVPAIFWSILAGLWCLPVPALVRALPRAAGWPLLFFLAASVFYLRLGFKYWTEMFVAWALSLFLTEALAAADANVLVVAAVVFAIAWVGQFYGHHKEGKKPSFFDDLLYLLIGPLWIADHLFTRAKSRL